MECLLRQGLALLILSFVAMAGCNQSDPKSGSQAAAGGQDDASGAGGAANDSASEGQTGSPSFPLVSSSSPGDDTTPPEPAMDTFDPISVPANPGPENTADTDGGDGVEAVPPSPARQLDPNLTPEKLLEFLGVVDRDMRMVALGRGGVTDQKQIMAKLRELAQSKLEAARRLKGNAELTLEQQVEGARGELQALSHLASLGDVKSAKALEILASNNLKSSDSDLVGESRMVLIGFAIEKVQTGKDGAESELVELIDELVSQPNLDIAVLLLIGQARQVLASNGFNDQAKKVRGHIIDKFADSPSREIADTAAQLAGNVDYDETETLLASILKGESVGADQWTESANKLVSKSKDIMTAKYLAGAAIEFEALGRGELAEATYTVMSSAFPNEAEAAGMEVQVAIKAHQARKDVIGQKFDPELDATDGKPISMNDYAGKIVLMPFWASSFPESMQVIPILKEMQEKNPDKIAIVGMNLDPFNTKFDAYLQDELGFRSFKSAVSEQATGTNPVATRFGVVSMPFVAIMNQKMQIEAIDFTGRKLAATISKLLENQ